MKVTKLGLVILLLLPLSSAAARPQQDSSSGQQQQSVADAARRAQEQKKTQPKAAKTWDNDTIPAMPGGGVNVVGQSGAAGGAQPSGAPGAAQKPATPATPEEKAAIQSDLNAAKAQLESLKTDLDIAQRKYSLDESSYIGKPDYSKDKAGAAALEDEKAQIDAKQQEIADAQKKIDDLQAQLNAAGSDASK